MDALFRTELESQCALMNVCLLELEKAVGGVLPPGAPNLMQELMRSAHSIKGAARIMKLSGLERLAHAMEDCFVLMQQGDWTPRREHVSALLKLVDFLGQFGVEPARQNIKELDVSGQLAALEQITTATRTTRQEAPGSAGPSPESTTRQQSPAPHAGSVPPSLSLLSPRQPPQLRVTPETLNRLLGLAGDSLVQSRRLQLFLEEMRDLAAQHNESDYAVRSLAALLRHSSLGHRTRAALEEATQLTARSTNAMRDAMERFESHDRQFARVSHRLYLEVLRARMRPISDITSTYPRMVRDLALSLGKDVRLEILGEQTQVDREVLSSLDTAIVHLLRNAVDHGCERPEERARASKPAQSRIRLEAQHRGGTLMITVTDDGPGIALEALRRAAATLRPAHAIAETANSDLLALLLLPGFTLKKEVTELSGRGVGLDLVHNTAKRLRGTVRIENQPGRGMSFTLQLPLTVSFVRALIARISHELYAVPLTAINKVVLSHPSDLVYLRGIPHLKLQQEHIPLADGRKIFGYGSQTEPPYNVVLLGERMAQAGLIVDRFIGERELVVQALDARIGKVWNIASAAILDDGRTVLITEPEELIQTILLQRHEATPL